MKGGFTDELGKRHESGHHYEVPYWEVLNEPDLERNLSPETYTRLYDAVVKAMRAVRPETKFVGVSLAFPGLQPAFFEHFLNPKNHKRGIPLDFILSLLRGPHAARADTRRTFLRPGRPS